MEAGALLSPCLSPGIGPRVSGRDAGQQKDPNRDSLALTIRKDEELINLIVDVTTEGLLISKVWIPNIQPRTRRAAYDMVHITAGNMLFSGPSKCNNLHSILRMIRIGTVGWFTTFNTFLKF